MEIEGCYGTQVEKSGLITGSRLGAAQEYELDDLEVWWMATLWCRKFDTLLVTRFRFPVCLCVCSYTDPHCLLGMQSKLEDLEKELVDVNGNAERLARSYSELVELQLVLEKASGFFDDAQSRASSAAFEARPSPEGLHTALQQGSCS